MKNLLFACMLFSMPVMLFSSQQPNINKKVFQYRKSIPIHRESGNQKLLITKENQKSLDAKKAQDRSQYSYDQRNAQKKNLSPIPGSPEYAQAKLNLIAQRHNR